MFNVRLLPSGRVFTTSSHQSLLEAGLQAGINLNYGCENGGCGECQARLHRGDLQPLQHSDFVFNARQKTDNSFLLCCHAAASDLEIEADEIGSVTQIPHQEIKARVYRLRPLAADVMAVSLRTPRFQPLRFLAGQHVEIELPNGLKRKKSIASCPCDGLKPEIHIKRHAADPFSEAVFTQLKKNQPILVRGPLGDFVMDDASQRPFVFVAFDTGFSAIKSLLEHALALEKQQAMSLHWICSAGSAAYMENYLRSIADAWDNFRFQVVQLPESVDATIEQVFVDLLADPSLPATADFFITLPQAYHRQVSDVIHTTGLNPAQVHIDTLVRI